MTSFTAGLWRRFKVLRRVVRGAMPSFDVDKEQINVFEAGDFYVFKHYFDLDEVFEALRDYYNREEYRFEVPEGYLHGVRNILEEYYYELNLVEDPDPYTVVKRRHADHPDMLFRNAVIRRSRGDYNFFVMKDRLSVEQAVNRGASRGEDVDSAFSL